MTNQCSTPEGVVSSDGLGPLVKNAHNDDPAYSSNQVAAIVAAAVVAERERCAMVCDDEARIRTAAGEKHPEDSESRGRCFAAARAAINCAKGCRNGEEV